MPICELCTTAISSFRRAAGTTRSFPLKTSSFWTVRTCLTSKYEYRHSGISDLVRGHPRCMVVARSCWNTGSFADACLICRQRSWLTGREALWSTSSSSLVKSQVLTSGRNALLRGSARNISWPLLHVTRRLYKLLKSQQHPLNSLGCWVEWFTKDSF